MQRYKNLSGGSNITQYDIGPDWIKVEFGDNSLYLYSYRAPGSENVEHMKSLALQGRGLNSFISTHIRKDYERKLR